MSSVHQSRLLHVALALLLLFGQSVFAASDNRAITKAAYIPLADHYAALVAYERYREQMQHADFQIIQMKNWDLLKGYFYSEKADLAFVMSPLALHMYQRKPKFRWIGLMHRDGNALAVNGQIEALIDINSDKRTRKPDQQIARLLKRLSVERGEQILVGVPHKFSTHMVVLYRYLQEHGVQLAVSPNEAGDVLGIAVAPPTSPAFLKSYTLLNQAAAIEQSLPWSELVDTQGSGKLVWYSKDVMPWPEGHVECIAIAQDLSIAHKSEALREVMFYLHKAGADIEAARVSGGEALDEIIRIVQKHIPAHSAQAIRASLDPQLMVINYRHLNVDLEGLRLIQDYALQSGLLRQKVNLDEFANRDFEVDDFSADEKLDVSKAIH